MACATENDRLLTRCAACGAYLHDRVAALNLFSTAWGVLEAPGTALQRVARSEQKNYVMLLFAAGGPAITACALVFFLRGSGGAEFAVLFSLIGVAGPILGIALWFAVASVTSVVWRPLFPRRSWRTVTAVIAYSLVPVVLFSITVLPAALAVYGGTLFGAQPDPWTRYPGIFLSLCGAGALLLLWHVALIHAACRVLGSTVSGGVAGAVLYLLTLAAATSLLGLLLAGSAAAMERMLLQ
jgi:hypothetical protein